MKDWRYSLLLKAQAAQHIAGWMFFFLFFPPLPDARNPLEKTQKQGRRPPWLDVGSLPSFREVFERSLRPAARPPGRPG